jgi:hypothetical protein
MASTFTALLLLISVCSAVGYETEGNILKLGTADFEAAFK